MAVARLSLAERRRGILPSNDTHTASVRVVESDEVARAVGRIFFRSEIAHGGVLFEVAGGQRKIGDQRSNVSVRVNAACDLLVSKNKHPALLLAKGRQTPFNLLDHEDEISKDEDTKDFIRALRQDGFDSVYFLPLRGLDGQLFVASATRRDRKLTDIEVRLIHSFCLEAVCEISCGDCPVEDAQRQIKLSARERQILIAAAKGMTEKDTARRYIISPSTVHAHLENCKRKLGVRSKIAAIFRALRLRELTWADITDDPESISSPPAAALRR